jgi:hypothetical protein
MRLNHIVKTIELKKAFNYSCNKAYNAVTFLLKDIILAWPRALFIAIPLASRDIKILSKARMAFMPQVNEVADLASTLIGRLPSSLDKIKKLTKAFAKIANAAEGITCDQVLEKLEEKRSNFKELGSFMNALLLPDEEDISDDREFIPEVVQTAALLNALVDDLSGRTGIFSVGKKDAEPGAVVAAKAQAVVVREAARRESESPLNPYAEPPSGMIDEAPVALAEAHKAPSYVKKEKPPRSCVILRPVPLNVVVHSSDEENFLKDTKDLGSIKKMSMADYIVSFVHFIAVDVLFGVPRFLIYDLPHMIIGFQKCTQSMVASVHPTAKSLIELKDILKAIHGLLLQLDRLAPVINGVELYLAKNVEADTAALIDHFKLLDASIASMLESTDVAHIHMIKKQMKSLLFKINPLLIKALDALVGRSLFSAATSKRASVSPKPVSKQPGDAASLSTGSTSGSSSSGEKDVVGGADGRPKTTVDEQIRGFFIGIGKGLKKGLSTPPASGSNV